MTDEPIVDYLRSRGRVDPPADLVGDIMRAVDAAPRRRAWFAPLIPVAAAVVGVALVVVIALLVRQPLAGSPPAASCAAGHWPATPISCETAVKIGDQAGARVERTRIWLTTLGAVKSAMAPTRQVAEPAETAEVWVIVYDGFWRCCPNAVDEHGSVIPQVDQMRWLAVAEAAREGTGFIYLQDWTGRPVPDLLPLPAAQSPTRVASPSSSVMAATLTEADALATLPALDSTGQWGAIALGRGADVGGYRSTASGGGFGPDADVSSLYFKNDPEVLPLRCRGDLHGGPPARSGGVRARRLVPSRGEWVHERLDHQADGPPADSLQWPGDLSRRSRDHWTVDPG